MRVARAPWDDWYVDGDRSAVFAGGNVLVLSELATAVVGRVDGPTDLAVLADHLAERFGAPADGDLMGATEAAVRELVDRGVLAVADETADE